MRQNRYVVLAASMLVLLCVGILYMWSVFSGPVVTAYGYDPGATRYIASVMLAGFVAGILVGGRIQDKTGPRPVVMGGSLLFALGILVTSFVLPHGIGWVYLFYSVIGGFGVGAAYNSAISCTQKWFPDKRGFATGMVVCAFGFSVVLFTPVATALITSLGVASTFRVLAIVFAIVCAGASLIVGNPPAGYLPAGYTPAQTTLAKKQYTTREVLRTPQFYLITVTMMFTVPAYFILNPLLKELGQSRGLSETLALAGLMITGIASASGRLAFPWLSDRIGRKNAILAIVGLTLLCAFAMIFVRGPLFLIVVALVAFAYGGSSGVFPAMTADFFGIKHQGSNYGCVMMGFGASAIIFPFIGQMTAKMATGDTFFLPFLFAALASAAGIVLTLLIQPPKETAK